MDKKAMLEALIAHFTKGNKAQFAKLLEVSPQTISAWLARSTFDSELIYTKYRYISAEWLLTGEGPMLKSTTPSTDGATSSPSIEHPQAEKSEKISSTEDTTAFLAYMREQATAHTKALKEKDTIIEQKNQQITDLRCQVTRLEGENRHLIEELDRIKMERTVQSSTLQSDDTSTSQQGDTSSQPDCAPRSHTA